MPDHELVWDRDALREYKELVGRRNDKTQVRKCVEGHLLALASNPVAAAPWKGPGDFRLHTFQCMDGDVTLYLRAAVQVLPEDRVAVLAFGPIAF
jgi:hypothetical protein